MCTFIGNDILADVIESLPLSSVKIQAIRLYTESGKLMLLSMISSRRGGYGNVSSTSRRRDLMSFAV